LIDPLQTLPVYTSLFNKLGIAAVVCTFIALAVLPLMRRLTDSHHSHNAMNDDSAAASLRDVKAEQ